MISDSRRQRTGLHGLRSAARLIAALALLLPSAAAADTEQQMKAGFIYNFALYVEWPAASFASAASPLSVCLADGRDTLSAFEHLKGKKIRDRAVTVGLLGDAGGACQIVYIQAAAGAEAEGLLRRVSGPGVLTIGDAAGFCGMGGIIGFYREGNKLRFEINTDAAQRAGLKLSSQLLKLARIVPERTAAR